MTNEWHPFDERDGESSDLSRDDTQPQPSLGQNPQTPPPAATDHGEGTRVIPPPQPLPAHDAPMERRRTGARSGVLPAAVLVGALVVGGAAGVGGAAAYDAVKGDSGTSSTTSDGAITTSSGKDTPTSNTTSSTAIESVSAKVLPSVVQINVTGSNETGTGSGIVLKKDGTILTNNHVASVAGKSGSITVNFQDGTSAKASIVGTDPVTDLAVIKAQGVDDATPAAIGNSSDLKVGQEVVAIGSPFGLGSTVTSGIVSALDRAVSVSTSDSGGDSGGGGVDPFGGSNPFGQQQQQQQGSSSQATTYPAIQTDAAINPGNSGGPLVNLAGQVVGINSSIRTSDSSTSSEGGSIGLGFSIPMSEVLPIVNQLVAGETPTHARLGVTVSDDSTSSSSASTGALVKSVQSGDSGDQAGIKTGDVITKVGDKVVSGADDLVATIRGHRPGDKVTLTLTRGGKTQTVTADLGSDGGSSSS